MHKYLNVKKEKQRIFSEIYLNDTKYISLSESYFNVFFIKFFKAFFVQKILSLQKIEIKKSNLKDLYVNLQMTILMI